MSKATTSMSAPLVSGPGLVDHTPSPEIRITRKPVGRIQRWTGFNTKIGPYLWVLFGAVMIGFVGARVGYLDFDGRFRDGAAPGEYFWLKERVYRIGMYLHLICILPCGLLSVFQFLPVIRHKCLIFHRINGYIVLILLFGGVIGALVIARHAFGGAISTQTITGVVSLATLISAILAYYNIKRLQIDQHRKWMLRTMFYMGSIITTRIIMGVGMVIITKIGTYETVWRCDQLMDTIHHNDAAVYYPACVENLNNKVIVPATMDARETAGSALRISFDMGFWLAFIIHAFGVELYIRLTAGESERLRMVSYERQVEAGISPAGSAGTTNDRLGDAKWAPTVVDNEY